MHIIHFISSLPWAYGALLLCILFALISTIGLLVVRQNISYETLKSHHDVAGFVFTNLGVLYAVLLGFIVVNVQQRFDKIEQMTEIEASYLDQLYRDAEIFPEKNKQKIRTSIISYAESILNNEWELMAQGIRSEKTIHALRDIWSAYYEIEPLNTRQEAWYSQSISRLNDLLSARLTRLLGTRNSLGSEMWSLLILGGVIIITFIWFFGVKNIYSHILMAVILASTTAFLLYLIYTLDTAFSGNLNVGPEAIHRVFNSFIRREYES